MQLSILPTAFALILGLAMAAGCSDGGAENPVSPAGAAGSGGTAGSTGSGGSAGSSGSAGSDRSTQPPGRQPDGGTDAEPKPPLTPACKAIQPGRNDGFEVDGLPRSFLLDLPDNVENAGPWPVVFNWHGLGDTAQNMRLLFSGEVNRSDFPFVLVTPEDTDFIVGALGMSVSMDWDVFRVGDGESNREVRLFDEILTCLKARWKIDDQHVHLAGFSIGGIVGDLIGVVRGEQIASIATYSGGYFSNPDNVESLGLLKMVGIDWPQPDHGNKYPQMILSGGERDVWAPTTGASVSFATFAQNDAKALPKAGHDVIYCDHGGGHMAPPAGMRGGRLLEFFRDHPLGAGQTPFAREGLPDNYADYCELRLAGADN